MLVASSNSILQSAMLAQISRLADNEDGKKEVIYLCKQLQPIAQVGPTCGLVALLMAEQMLFKCDNDQDDKLPKLLSTAVKMKLTKQGEMFSAEGMAELAKYHMNADACVKRDIRKHKKDIIRHCLLGLPILVPYDTDANHEPCMRKGHKAHWAVIHGFCVLMDKSILNKICGTMKADENGLLNLYGQIKDHNIEKICTIICEKNENLFLLARQGKSRLIKMFQFDLLCESNDNLLEVGKERNNEHYLLPVNGDLSEILCSQFVMLK